MSNPDWSWPAARSKFYQALTTTDAAVRGERLGNTFLTLGHVMHLLADAAVPEHSRNDQHLIFPNGSRYEEWEEKDDPNTLTGGYRKLPAFISQNAVKINYSDITTIQTASGYIPISNFWDTVPAAGGQQSGPGLSEYTNYNFFSPGTIFSATYTYPINPLQMVPRVELVTDADGQPQDKLYGSSGFSVGPF